MTEKLEDFQCFWIGVDILIYEFFSFKPDKILLKHTLREGFDSKDRSRLGKTLENDSKKLWSKNPFFGNRLTDAIIVVGDLKTTSFNKIVINIPLI